MASLAFVIKIPAMFFFMNDLFVNRRTVCNLTGEVCVVNMSDKRARDGIVSWPSRRRR